MPTDLNILKKAFQNATATYETVTPGNEPLTRRDSVQAEQVFGAPAIPNEVGGWVASGGFPYQSTEYLAGSTAFPIQTGAMPPARGYSETNPGAAGYPDVDFVLYNWGTNRFGNKGGALLGHPISWEVVGPTAKSPFLHWQWAVDAGLNSISLEFGATTAALTGGGGSVPTVEDAYNLSAGGIGDYNGGLYVLVTLTGGEADSTGVGALLAPANPLAPLNPATSMFEVFRVASYAGQKINLETTKPLSDYFTVPGANAKIRAITLIRPKVTRLAAFPLSVSGVQRNQVFVFLPPETAARSELLPPYVGTGNCPDWSVNGIGGDTGDVGYGGNAPLPVPLPLYRLDGYIDASLNVLNQMQVYVTLGAGQSIFKGQIVRVTSHANDSITSTQEPSVFGYFESDTNLGVSGTLDLRRVPEVNPATGAVFYGPGPSGGANELVSVEVYDPISTVFTDPVLNIAKIAATRLDHLIDPRNAPYTFQRFSGTDAPVSTVTPPGASIFDTVTGSSNPGNLTELGFRVVLFPAKDEAGVAVPDFDNPITSERVVLDPTLPATTAQTIEIDYSAGVLYLSHQPVPGAGCTVAPNGIVGTGTNNPRGEIVLFAACVPYSREPSQRGGGLRVTAARPADATYNPFGANDSFDVYGKRCLATPSPLGVFASGSNLTVTPLLGEFPPETGWFYFVEVSGGTVSSVSAPNYYPYYNGGVLYSVSVEGGTYNVTTNTRVVFIKGPWNQVPTTDLWYAGTTRGASKRADTVNFKGANVSLGADGSVTVQTVATLDEAYRAGDPFTPGAGRVITVDGAAVEAQPDAAANNDTFRSSFRVSVADVFGAKSLTGFDFKSNASALIATADPYAGFSDRRVFAPTSTSTTLIPGFTVDVTVDVVTATGGEFFWFAGTYNSTLLLFALDLIEIEGVTYVIYTYGVNGTKVVIRNLDGTIPALSLTGVSATVYRPRLITGRGSTGTPADNLNTWVTAQEESAQLFTNYPFGALNLYAGSATAIAPGDGGGSIAALAFWSRYMVDVLGVFLEVNLSLNGFDTFGRFNSILTPVFMSGGAGPDYTFRGDYASRVDKTIAPASILYTYFPTFGHIVEDYSYDRYRYDFFSMFPMSTTGTIYAATVTIAGAFPATPTEVQVSTPILYDRVPYGSAVLELLDINGDTSKRGLYLVTYFTTPGVITFLGFLALNGIGGLFSGAVTDTINFRLHYTNVIGKHLDAPYADPRSSPSLVYHSPTQNLGVGFETNAVGLVISGPARIGSPSAPGEDRHAYRVTTAADSASIGASNYEVAALDLDGYHKAEDYLYLSSRTITKQINSQLGQSFGSTNNPEWHWIDGSHYWQGAGNVKKIKFPLDLPRSSTRTNSAAALTHRTRLTSVIVTGTFGAGVTPAYAELHKITVNPAAVPTSTPIYLGPAVTPIATTYNLAALGNTQYTIGVWADNAGTVPVYVDNTSTDYYYLTITSSDNTGTNDRIYGVSMVYTDPGPRNY
jgi:hypothetical protein